MKFKIAAAAIITLAAAIAQEGTRSVWDGVYTDAQAKRGQGLYNQHCASCHGDQLTGGEMAPPLAGGEFLSNWNGLTLGDLFERIRKTMPLNEPGNLNREKSDWTPPSQTASNKRCLVSGAAR
jgi:mono/diheme cytochrome c family protein